MKSHGCEPTARAATGTDSYRPTGYVPEGCVNPNNGDCQTCPSGETCVNSNKNQIYIKTMDKDIYGFDISAPTGVTEERCMDLCNSESTCLSALHKPHVDNTCNLKTKNRESGAVFADLAGAVVLEKIQPAPCPDDGSRYKLKWASGYCNEHVEWQGSYHLSTTELTSNNKLLECTNLCRDNPLCVVFDLSKAAPRECRLYSKHCTQSPEDTNWDHYIYLENRQTCPAPLTQRKLISSGLSCSDNAIFNTGDAPTGMTLDECENKCLQEEGCVWFQFTPGNGRCAGKGYGCEATADR